jgi:hypothetical protein
MARPRFQFSHSYICEQFIYSLDRSVYFVAGGLIVIGHRYMNVEIRKEATHFHFWEYKNQIVCAVQMIHAY